MELDLATIADQEKNLRRENFSITEALQLGERAVALASARRLPIVIEIRFGKWTVFKAALPGSSIDNDSWVDRKARVVLLKNHSTLYERYLAQSQGVDWYEVNNAPESLHAVHGGGFPIQDLAGNYLATLLVSGLPQVEDHLFAVELLSQN